MLHNSLEWWYDNIKFLCLESRKYIHPWKYTHPPPFFQRQVVAKGHLLLETTPTLFAQTGKHLNSCQRGGTMKWRMAIVVLIQMNFIMLYAIP